MPYIEMLKYCFRIWKFWFIIGLGFFFYRKSPTGQDFAENVKHKVWLKVGLDAVEIVKSKFQLSSVWIEF